MFIKLENIERKTNYLEENENFRTTVIRYVLLAIKIPRLLLVYTVSKKQDTKLLPIPIFKILLMLDSVGNCNKAVFKFPTTS